jgi:iron complex outermembrane recepter protein
VEPLLVCEAKRHACSSNLRNLYAKKYSFMICKDITMQYKQPHLSFSRVTFAIASMASLAQAVAQPAPTALPTVVVIGEKEKLSLQQSSGLASRLGLTVHETPASVEVLPNSLLKERGVRSVSESAQVTTGVTAADFPAEPSNFSMRGFANSQLNTLYNGIKIGPPNMTSRVMDVGNLERIEFLKGPASLMTGEGASGGAINFVTRQPHRGPASHEIDFSVGSFGAVRSHFGSGGSTAIKSVDYRLDVTRSAGDGFIDGTRYENLHVSGGLDWHLQPGLKLFGAIEYKKDDGSAYWGTPLVSAAAPGIQSQGKVVSGTYLSGFNASNLGEVTIDNRTLRTNYNVLDNRNKAEENWLRLGADWQVDAAFTLRSQFYRYSANREWFNNEVIAFNATTGLIDRERFYVAHEQTTVGTKTEVQWDASLGGMRNRLVAAVDWSELEFSRPGAANFPGDSVSLTDPQRGRYGLLTTQRQTANIRNTAFSLEDHLVLGAGWAVVTGVRHELIELERSSLNTAGVQRAGFPFSQTWRPTTGRLGLTWEPMPGLNLYSQYATATDVAANNIFLLRGNQPLDLTRSRTLEAGVKQAFWNQRAEWNLAVYNITRSNVYAAQGGRALGRAGQQVSYGVEASVALLPAAAWQIWGNLALNRTSYENYNFEGGSYSGNTPPNAPRVVANAGASYRWTGRWPVELSGSLRHIGERFHSDANTMKLLSYTVADAALSVDLAAETKLVLRVRNLTNKTYAVWSDPFYPDQILLGAPRSVELALNAKF